MRNIGYYAMQFILLFAIVFIAYCSYLTFYPFNVIQINNSKSLPIDKNVYKPGEKIYITFDYEKFMDIPPEVKKEIICSKTSPRILPEPRRLPPGKHTGDGAVKIDHTIPLDAITDSGCNIYIWLAYEPNSLHEPIRMLLKTQSFNITKP